MKYGGPWGETISRKWAMPSRHTFTIKPIAELLAEASGGVWDGWVDPFAGWHSPAEITNDLNPEAPTTYHETALEFLARFAPNSVEGVLFDPPYTPRQVSECYRGIGREVTAEDTRASFWSKCKDAIARAVIPGGLVVCCGFNSSGIGKTRGFELLNVLLVPHGGQHNDTIVTVERKR